MELKRLDDCCTEREIERIDFLKLDVEGHELKALNGASRMISEKRMRIVSQGLTPIDTYSEFLETFATANFLAIAR